MEDKYINPFGVVVYEALHNLTSGTIIEDELAEGILKVYEVGSDKAQKLKQARIYGRQQRFHAPIKFKVSKALIRPSFLSSKTKRRQLLKLIGIFWLHLGVFCTS